MKELTERQKEILSFIAEYIKNRSFPPTIREVAEYFSISVKGAHDHVTALRKKGQLKQEEKRPRTLELTHLFQDDDSELIEIPLLGTVAAGMPILAEENYDGTIKIPRLMVKNNKEYFALQVRGDSMINAGILDGDTAIIMKQNTVRSGEIVVAVVDEAATLKRFFRESTRVRLQSENPAWKPIYSRDVKILGRLVNIIRSY